MRSMTGYGRSNSDKHSNQSRTKKIADAWVRSVNGRFLEVRVHLPREWAELEPEIRSLTQSRLERGTVDVHVSRSRGAVQEAHVEIDVKLAKQWTAALRELAKNAGFSASKVPFELVAKAPDVLRIVNEEALSSSDKSAILKAVSESLAALEYEKQREGKEIETEMIHLLDQLDLVVTKVSELAKAAPDDLQSRFKNRMDRLEASGIKGPGAEDARFHQEVAVLIDRGDIREEITRLMAHLRVYRELVQTKDAASGKSKTKVGQKQASVKEQGAIGKTLDFYAQELLREVNTIGSKSQTAELTRIVVEAKTLVEKIREQVQNIE